MVPTGRRELPKRRPHSEHDIEWDSSREWPDRWVRWLLRAVVEDYQQENVSLDFFAKLKERGLSRGDVISTITSRNSYIGKYLYTDGVNRIGFWHSRTEVFVAWKPRVGGNPSLIVTCFMRKRGIEYMRSFEQFREVRGPRRR